MKQPIHHVLSLILQYAQTGGLEHSRGCELRIPSSLRHSNNERECTCGFRELNLLVEGEILKSFSGFGAVQIGEVEFSTYTSLKKQGLIKLYRRKGLPFVRLTKTGEAFVSDHNRAMGLNLLEQLTEERKRIRAIREIIVGKIMNGEKPYTELQLLTARAAEANMSKQERLAKPHYTTRDLMRAKRCEKCGEKSKTEVYVCGARWAVWCGCA